MAGYKLVEDWYLPEDETSVQKKINSIRQALKNPNFPIGDYQIELRQETLNQVSKFRNAVDIGAHVGIWSVAFASLFQNVYAFEINPKVLPSLHQNLESRKIKNVQVYPFGLGQKEERVALSSNVGKSMAIKVLPNEPGEILIKNLDSLDLKDIDLIKLDIEGYEGLALLGGENTIRKFRPVIVMEDRDFHLNYYSNLPSPSQILKDFGMKELKRFRKDVIFGWG